jgi:hypothetical protein
MTRIRGATASLLMAGGEVVVVTKLVYALASSDVDVVLVVLFFCTSLARDAHKKGR